MSHIRLFHRHQSREQRLLAIQKAATSASRGHHLSREEKTLLSNLSPAERKLVAIRNNLQMTPGHAVPFRRLRSQSVVFQPEAIRRSPLTVRSRSLSVSDAPERQVRPPTAERLTEHEEDARFRIYAQQVYVLFAVLAVVMAVVGYYAFLRIRERRPAPTDDTDA